MRKHVSFEQRDYNDMVALQKKVAEVLLRANREGVDAVIAAFALTRLIRELLRRVEPASRQALVDQVIVPFIQGEPATGEGGKLITLH
jgi:hypothetical protein